MSLVILAEAMEEYEAQAAYLESRRAGLGEEFVREVERRLAQIEEDPLRFPRLETLASDCEYRRAFCKRFHTIVVYEVHGEETFVVTISDARRHPRHWLGRRPPQSS